jgi:hypothetical protein
LAVKTTLELVSLLRDETDDVLQAAELGDTLEKASMAEESSDADRFQWAQTSAAHGERDGFYWLGYCYRGGNGCEKDLERAKGNYLTAAELGYVDAMIELRWLLDENDPNGFFWLGKAAVNGSSAINGSSWTFLNDMSAQIRNFNSGTGHANVVFAIGRALKGYIENKKRTIFDNNEEFKCRTAPANQAFQFYHFQLKSYRKAVDNLILVGIRNEVVKDIRGMIARMIWDSREEAKSCDCLLDCLLCSNFMRGQCFCGKLSLMRSSFVLTLLCSLLSKSQQ